MVRVQTGSLASPASFSGGGGGEKGSGIISISYLCRPRALSNDHKHAYWIIFCQLEWIVGVSRQH